MNAIINIIPMNIIGPHNGIVITHQDQVIIFINFKIINIKNVAMNNDIKKTNSPDISLFIFCLPIKGFIIPYQTMV